MKVNVAISGKLHFHNYVRDLDNQGVLNYFYCAYKLGANSGELGVLAEKIANTWVKEYTVFIVGAFSVYA